jgi:hypothetical protein
LSRPQKRRFVEVESGRGSGVKKASKQFEKSERFKSWSAVVGRLSEPRLDG